jgi:hypothetical protein
VAVAVVAVVAVAADRLSLVAQPSVAGDAGSLARLEFVVCSP